MENVTAFEDLSAKTNLSGDGAMELDKKEVEIIQGEDESTVLRSFTKDDTDLVEESVSIEKDIETNAQETEKQNDPEIDNLYPVFWALQESFSMPTRLFDSKHFLNFKDGLACTIRKFQSVHQELQTRGTSKQPDENRRVMKRKRSGLEDDVSNSFNPRYLTSRDLFDLEVCIKAKRRNSILTPLRLATSHFADTFLYKH